MDFLGVIWTRAATGTPVKMGQVVVTPTETRFSYSPEYLALGPDAPGLSLLGAPRFHGREPVIFPARGPLWLHPQLLALIPGEGRRNIQRRAFSRLLARQGRLPAPGPETDWALLMQSGHNGIGHLDVFPDDRAAETYYSSPSRPTAPSPASRSRFWRALADDILLEQDVDMATVTELLGPTPSPEGMIPKLLVAIPDAPAWAGAFAPPGTRAVEGRPYTDVLMKIEPPEYAGVAALEALCLDVHRRAGFEVPRSWLARIDGLTLLAVERFDRTQEGMPVPLESLFSVLATGQRTFSSELDTDLAQLGHAIERLGLISNIDVQETRRTLYRRLLLAFCTGNGDLHLRNLAFLGRAGDLRLAPVYDPAPMRAWPQHAMRLSIPLAIDPDAGTFADNLLAVGRAFGLTPAQILEERDRALELTADHAARVQSLAGVPEAVAQRLARIVEQERDALARGRIARQR